MHEKEKLSLEAIGRFVDAREEIRFESGGHQQVYGWVERVLLEQEYARQSRAVRGLLLRYVEEMTGSSRAQVTRIIARYTNVRARAANHVCAAASLSGTRGPTSSCWPCR